MQKTVIATALAALLAQGARAQTTQPTTQDTQTAQPAQDAQNNPQPAAPSSSTPTALTPTADAKTSAGPTFMVAKFKAKFYGFAEFDTYFDQTQSFSEIQGNGLVAAPGTTAFANGRTTFSARNSRLGFSLESPEVNGVKGSATIEGDFFGYDPNPFGATTVCTKPTTPAAPGAPANCTLKPTNSAQSEAGFFTAPTFRVRHAFAKLETPYVDILGGQYWTLMGFNATFIPMTVALQGVVGEIYQRTPQLRVGKTLKLGGGNKLELEVAAQRPVQRDSSIPDLAAGIRFELGGWSGWKGSGGTGVGLANLQVAATGILKQYRALNPVAGNIDQFQTVSGSAIAVDAIIPIIPATKDSHSGALTFVGEAATGSGVGDLYTGLSLGTGVGAPGGAPVPGYVGPNIDAGSAGFNANTGLLDTVNYKSMMLNLQYFTPIKPLSLSAVYSLIQSDNSGLFGAPAAVASEIKYGSLGAFIDASDAVRFGVEGIWTRDRMQDASLRVNRRLQGSMWFIF